MSDETFQVDLDNETVWLDDGWYGREELAIRIKLMIEGGDYRIARPSSALEMLESAIAAARVVAVRVAPEIADALDEAASRAGRPKEALVREAIAYYLQQPAAAASSADVPVDGEMVVSEEPVVFDEGEPGKDEQWSFGK